MKKNKALHPCSFVNCLILLLMLEALSACGGGGDSTPTPAVVLPVPQVVPLAPQKVTTTAADSQVTIKWDSVLGATSYNIYWNDMGDVSTFDNKITNVASPYTHVGYTNDSMHYYIVTAVNTGGESPVSSEGAAISTLMSGIAFADANLQSCIDSKNAIWSFEITDLDCSSKNISDLSGIENLTNLSPRLYLDINNIAELSPLSTLTNLIYLYLGDNDISDISPLASLANLTYLWLFDNNVSDVSSLTSLPNFNILSVGGNSVSDLS